MTKSRTNAVFNRGRDCSGSLRGEAESWRAPLGAQMPTNLTAVNVEQACGRQVRSRPTTVRIERGRRVTQQTQSFSPTAPPSRSAAVCQGRLKTDPFSTGGFRRGSVFRRRRHCHEPRTMQAVTEIAGCTARKRGSAYAAWEYSLISPWRIVRRRTHAAARSVIGGGAASVVGRSCCRAWKAGARCSGRHAHSAWRAGAVRHG